MGNCVILILMNTLLIVLPILTVLMFDLGLTLDGGDFSLVLKKPLVVLTALCGQIFLLPVLAFGIAYLFRLPAVFMIGLVLIGCCPGGSSSNLFSKIAGGDVALSVTLTALSSIITLLTLPFVMRLVTGYAGESVGITLPVGNLLKQNLLLMLLPVALGILVNRFFPKAAGAIDRVLSKAVFPSLLVIVTIFYIQNRDTIATHIVTLGGCVTLLILSASLLTGIVSRLLHFDACSRRTLVIEVGMQNAAQAIAVASSPFIFNNTEMAIPGILYSLLMNLVLLTYVGIIRFGPAARHVSAERL